MIFYFSCIEGVKMARNLGVPYTDEKPYYFISYNSEDESRVTKYAKNKIHPCLKPFCELSETDKNKDIEGIEALLSLEGI